MLHWNFRIKLTQILWLHFLDLSGLNVSPIWIIIVSSIFLLLRPVHSAKSAGCTAYPFEEDTMLPGCLIKTFFVLTTDAQLL